MKNVCVITGGGSGMGLATAKVLGKENYIIIVGRTKAKLDNALKELKSLEIEAESFACDISDRSSVDKLVARAILVGKVSRVIHAAGLSPHMGDARTILNVNAIGTININEAFFEVMGNGSCIINVSSMSGYMLPDIILPKRRYKYSRINIDLFRRRMMKYINLFPKNFRSSISYVISKNFVIWYAKTDAVKFGEKGIRILSVSPGFFETPMGEAEKEKMETFTMNSAIKRSGNVEEMAYLLEFCTSDKASYLTGVDILCDGGCLAARETRKQRV